MHWIFPAIIFGLVALVIFFIIPEPYKVPQEGVDYKKIVLPDGSGRVLYEINGALTPDKPEPFSFLERFNQGMDRIAMGG